MATGLKQELRLLKKSSSNKATGNQQSHKKLSKDNQEPHDEKETQKRTLKLIRDALRKDEKKKSRDQIAQQVKESGSSAAKPAPPKMNQENENELNFNKEENEEVMEGLMNKIVVNPSFVNDEKLNAKIEKIFGVEAFQKMVDNADVFQDISNTSLFN